MKLYEERMRQGKRGQQPNAVKGKHPKKKTQPKISKQSESVPAQEVTDSAKGQKPKSESNCPLSEPTPLKPILKSKPEPKLLEHKDSVSEFEKQVRCEIGQANVLSCVSLVL